MPAPASEPPSVDGGCVSSSAIELLLLLLLLEWWWWWGRLLGRASSSETGEPGLTSSDMLPESKEKKI